MIKTITTIITFLALCFSGYNSQLLSQNEVVRKEESNDYSKIKLLNFHYVIYRSYYISIDPSVPNSGSKDMHILLDEDAYSKENLEELFTACSEAFLSQERLNIFVLTNIKQVNIRGFFMSGAPTPPEYLNHHRAFYHRDQKNEFFRYTKTPTSREMEVHIIKGKAVGL